MSNSWAKLARLLGVAALAVAVIEFFRALDAWHTWHAFALDIGGDPTAALTVEQQDGFMTGVLWCLGCLIVAVLAQLAAAMLERRNPVHHAFADPAQV